MSCLSAPLTIQALEDADVVPFSNEHNLVPCINGEMPKVVEYSFLALRQQPLGP
jgi:hypothetical protein